jgi:hypothetical protein
VETEADSDFTAPVLAGSFPAKAAAETATVTKRDRIIFFIIMFYNFLDLVILLRSESKSITHSFK